MTMPYTYLSSELTTFLDGYSDTVDGVLNGILPHRIPLSLRSQIEDPWFIWNEFCPVGIHMRMRITADTTITLATYELERGNHKLSVVYKANNTQRVRDINVMDSGQLIPDLSTGSFALKPGKPMTLRLVPEDAENGVFDLILPHTCLVELIAMESAEAIEPVALSKSVLNWVHYGSSISHCAQVDSPARRWPEQVSRALGLHLRDFSLSGNAQMDPCMARAIGGTPADIITCAIGINITNADSMRERMFVPVLHGFLDTIRESHPNTQLILCTACSCPMQEDAPGPVFMKPNGDFVVSEREVENDAGALTLQRTRQLIEHVVERRSDPWLKVVDGQQFFGMEDSQMLVDNLHPGPKGIDLIAERVTAVLNKAISHIRS